MGNFEDENTAENERASDAEHQKTKASSKAPKSSGPVFFWRLVNKKENKKYSDFWEKHKNEVKT
jgi:hypothetical protein